MESDLLDMIQFSKVKPLLIDPKAELKLTKQAGNTDTLVPFDKISSLAAQAQALYLNYLMETDNEESASNGGDILDMEILQHQVDQSHWLEQVRRNQEEVETHTTTWPRRLLKKKAKEVAEKKKELKLIEELRYLYCNKHVTIGQLAKRFKVKYAYIYRQLKKLDQQPPIQHIPATKIRKYKKMHDRSKDFIEDYLSAAKVPVQVSALRQAVKEGVQLNLSKSMLNCYLKNQLGLSYKKVKPITVAHNTPQAKLQRQLAAAYFIEYMAKGKTIVNVDESVLNKTDARQRGWWYKGNTNMITNMQRISSLSIIAAVSSQGKFFFTVNSGKNNSDTFLLLLIKLSNYFDATNPNWRQNTIIMVDNAPYHRSKLLMEKYPLLKLPIMFLGPYQFKLAPVELMFSYIKNRDLNPLNTKALGSSQRRNYMKELSVQLSRLDTKIVRKSFCHCLTHALEALCLSDL